jgi:hypothetical protein
MTKVAVCSAQSYDLIVRLGFLLTANLGFGHEPVFFDPCLSGATRQIAAGFGQLWRLCFLVPGYALVAIN